MFQLVHDYNALPIQGAVEFLYKQHYCANFIIHGKSLTVLIINKTFLIFKSNYMRMFHFLVFSHIDRRLSFLKIFLVKLKHLTSKAKHTDYIDHDQCLLET